MNTAICVLKRQTTFCSMSEKGNSLMYSVWESLWYYIRKFVDGGVMSRPLMLHWRSGAVAVIYNFCRGTEIFGAVGRGDGANIVLMYIAHTRWSVVEKVSRKVIMWVLKIICWVAWSCWYGPSVGVWTIKRKPGRIYRALTTILMKVFTISER